MSYLSPSQENVPKTHAACKCYLNNVFLPKAVFLPGFLIRQHVRLVEAGREGEQIDIRL